MPINLLWFHNIKTCTYGSCFYIQSRSDCNLHPPSPQPILRWRANPLARLRDAAPNQFYGHRKIDYQKKGYSITPFFKWPRRAQRAALSLKIILGPKIDFVKTSTEQSYG